MTRKTLISYKWTISLLPTPYKSNRGDSKWVAVSISAGKTRRASAFTPKPKPNILQTRAFSSGKHARSSELPKTDILQTRPFSDPAQKSSGAEKQPPTPELLEKAAAFGYNGVSIPSTRRY